MAENYTVRINLRSRKDLENFKKFETIMILKGKDFSKWIGGILGKEVKANKEILDGLNILSGEEIRGYMSRKYGKDIHRNHLVKLRREVWTEGVEYFCAPSGKSKSFRYDLEKCLPGLKSLPIRGWEHLG